ncbi:hypothetical protein F4V89_27785 [Neorhizobium galegae]|uniref:hypothetical protein n=1 Tax=Neorhizobium galegae TaxID=399 RepID=UPI0013544267|nr:hypothetical protein [Neorhizobium galegae]KAB1109387.1 hypothetical protein F4V89_27785 [Neorhizobium galegae]MCQ1773524.1 hypothetical protein [Neorhizobium galegae]MCQ1800331.1 hypothetical protein [Neorhizobium galegae]
MARDPRYWRESVQEAIFALGYLRPEAEGKLMELMPLAQVRGPRTAAAAFRAQGKQLSANDKKRLGLRQSAAISVELVDDLTPKGLLQPLSAHEITLQRAVFTERRLRAVAAGLETRADYYLYATGSTGCPGCARLKTQRAGPGEVDPSHPLDCIHEACPVGIVPETDHRLRYQMHQGPPTDLGGE